MSFPECPIPRWRALSAFQEELIRRLSRARTLRIQAPGTDLTLRVEGRIWINSDGRRNMPSGEVFTGPLEDSAEGEVREGEEIFLSLLETDEGARRLGEIGLRDRPVHGARPPRREDRGECPPGPGPRS